MLWIGDVSGNPDDAAEAPGGVRERFRAPGVDDEPPPALGQRARERETQAAGGSGDDSDGHAATRTTGPVATASGNWS